MDMETQFFILGHLIFIVLLCILAVIIHSSYESFKKEGVNLAVLMFVLIFIGEVVLYWNLHYYFIIR